MRPSGGRDSRFESGCPEHCEDKKADFIACASGENIFFKNMNTDKQRCGWVPENDALYKRYHDQEWGVPVYDDNKLFEFLVLESAQAGLSWRTILARREGYRRAFAHFDPKQVAGFTERDVEVLLKNRDIIRNRKKIEAAIQNAQCFLDIQKEFKSFARYAWQFVGGTPIQNKWQSDAQVPAKTPESEKFSKDLKERGFRFLGPTIMYAHMQATGMVNDHIVQCFRHGEIEGERT